MKDRNNFKNKQIQQINNDEPFDNYDRKDERRKKFDKKRSKKKNFERNYEDYDD